MLVLQFFILFGIISLTTLLYSRTIRALKRLAYDIWTMVLYYQTSSGDDSVIKVNHHEDEMPAWPPSGYVGLAIARDGVAPWSGRHPDGGAVRLVPTGTDGIVGIGITVSTPDPARMMAFYVDAMEFEAVAPSVARCGASCAASVACSWVSCRDGKRSPCPPPSSNLPTPLSWI